MPLEKTQKCPVCHGYGTLPNQEPCKRCKGKGEISVALLRRTDVAESERRVG